jgi:hypothetical protein
MAKFFSTWVGFSLAFLSALSVAQEAGSHSSQRPLSNWKRPATLQDRLSQRPEALEIAGLKTSAEQWGMKMPKALNEDSSLDELSTMVGQLENNFRNLTEKKGQDFTKEQVRNRAADEMAIFIFDQIRKVKPGLPEVDKLHFLLREIRAAFQVPTAEAYIQFQEQN